MTRAALLLHSCLALGLSGCFSPKVPTPSGGSDSSSSGGESSGGNDGGALTGTGTGTPDTTTSDTTSGDDGDTGSDGGIEASTSTSEGMAGETSTGVAPSCGDGNVDPGEDCDDGNDEDADACSNACVEQFFGGDATPCNAAQSEVCDFLNGTCHRTVSAAAGGAVCFWEDYSSGEQSCDDTPGIWTPPDSMFGMAGGVNILDPGACITQVGNLACSAADQATCDSAGANVCYQSKDVDGIGNVGAALCGWDVSQSDCDDTPGIWTSAGSVFGQNQPNSVPPGSDGACISQVTNFD